MCGVEGGGGRGVRGVRVKGFEKTKAKEEGRGERVVRGWEGGREGTDTCATTLPR